mmetsp:Transcript_16187/g.27282  ORF Transcript_16187/g.27282 Transcript_16187/m.27282 type:complete len:236 (-) Transcript_16187:424-1131(-)|eukprot:CAMPEP_0198208792 /NCGR_PEP_ID=MMETSP1445-20131203/12138_1 /TAXON_ID=36898 /ORGANISM="Pyramimonas sp., Strain CCMP2087" /LENGTH=235 /DNA_ID=CAMNT_0043882333 /DNA_START=209 /DNA_END=916 /DNA_ORIENTATION=+
MVNLIAFDLTHVRYEDGDSLGKLLALVTLAPVFIFVGLFGALLARREIQYATFMVGIVLNDLLSVALKKVIQEPRPPTCVQLEMCDSYGMPSSHSSYMTFVAVYVALDLARHLNRYPNCDLIKLLIGGGVWPLTASVMYSRVYLGYHSPPQVAAGAALGVAAGLAWHVLTHRLHQTAYPVLEASCLCRLFAMKDSCHIEDVHTFEYNNALRARRESLQTQQKSEPIGYCSAGKIE